MKRLTKRITENQIELSAKANPKQYVNNPQRVHMKHPFWNVFNRLEEYEDLEERGLLLRLPCKVGDIVYKICPQSKHIEFGQMWDGKIVKHPCQKCPWQCCDCKNIGFEKDMDNIVQDVVAMNEIWIIARKQYFGSIYFLTKEEAEAKLRELQSEVADSE